MDREVIFDKISCGETDVEAPYNHLQTLNDAYRVYIDCASALRWIYIAKYCLPEGEAAEGIFQMNQDSLEQYANRLWKEISTNWAEVRELFFPSLSTILSYPLSTISSMFQRMIDWWCGLK